MRRELYGGVVGGGRRSGGGGVNNVGGNVYNMWVVDNG